MKNGFALIELMIYLTLSVFMGMLVMEWAVTTNQEMQRLHTQTIARMMLYAALDHCARDLRAATDPIVQVGDAAYVWKVGNEYVGWERDAAGRLMRSQGLYVLNKKAWHSRTKSCCADHITQFSLSSRRHLHICVLCHERSISLESRVAMRSKEIT